MSQPLGLDITTMNALSGAAAPLTKFVRAKVRKANPDKNRTERSQEKPVVASRGKVLYKAGFYMTDNVSNHIMRTTPWVRTENMYPKTVPRKRLKRATGGKRLFAGAGKKGWDWYKLPNSNKRTSQAEVKKDMRDKLTPVLNRKVMKDLKVAIDVWRIDCRKKKMVYDATSESADKCRPRKKRAAKKKS